jgi:hypothetical protein
MPKLGGTSAKPKKMRIFFGFAFGLHTLAAPKLGGTSAKPKKMQIFFGFAFGLH